MSNTGRVGHREEQDPNLLPEAESRVVRASAPRGLLWSPLLSWYFLSLCLHPLRAAPRPSLRLSADGAALGLVLRAKSTPGLGSSRGGATPSHSQVGNVHREPGGMLVTA